MSRGPETKPSNMTPRQEKWFASVIESLERETGRTVDEWVAVARACPETRPGARKTWFKEQHGLGTNRAGVILGMAFPSASDWSRPEDLRATVWADADSRAILEAVEAAARPLPDLVIAQRKAFTAFSREFQFAALRPVKGGAALLGLALGPEADPRLQPPKRESWSERLKSALPLASSADVDTAAAALLKQAWERS